MAEIDVGAVHKSHPHLFADAIETLVLFGGQGPFSKADATSLINQSAPSDEDVISNPDQDLDDDNYSDFLSVQEISDAKQKQIDAVFEQFAFRVKAFGSVYPFAIDENKNLDIVSVAQPGMTTYAFLLCCSRLRSFGPKAAQKKMADRFEELCAIALRGMLNDRAEVIEFGPHSAQRRTLGTDMRVAIPNLAQRLGVPLDPKWQETEETAQGDGGIDLIGVIDLDDQPEKLSESWTITAQCAAHERAAGWEKKTLEAFRGITKRLSFQHKPSNALFIPGAYRKSDGTWANSTKDKDALLMDRVRILHNIASFETTDQLCWEWLNACTERQLELDNVEPLRDYPPNRPG